MSNPEEVWLEDREVFSKPVTTEIEVQTLLSVMLAAMEKRAKKYRAEMMPASEVSLKADAYGDTALNALIFSTEDHLVLDMFEQELTREYLQQDQESDEE